LAGPAQQPFLGAAGEFNGLGVRDRRRELEQADVVFRHFIALMRETSTATFCNFER
jgi:hypothetical protein